MSYHLTNTLPEKSRISSRSQLAKTDPPSKNRVWKFSTQTYSRTWPNHQETPETTSETSVTITITVSGLPFWPSRDPIGERGSLNLQQFVGNLPIGLVDINGLLIWIDPVNPGNDPPVCISCPSDPDPFDCDSYAWDLFWRYVFNDSGGTGFIIGDEVTEQMKNSTDVAVHINTPVRIEASEEMNNTSCGESDSKTIYKKIDFIQPLGPNVGAWQLRATAICDWKCDSYLDPDLDCCCNCSGKCDVSYSISKKYTFNYTEDGNIANDHMRGMNCFIRVMNLGRDTSFFLHGDWNDEITLSGKHCP